MNYEDILEALDRLGSPDNIAGMARYGITPTQTFGVRIPELRRLAKQIGKDHDLATRLWQKDTRETRILASMVADPDRVDERQMDAWVKEFSYWEICDQCCMNLFEKTSFAYDKAVEWSDSEGEFVKRAGFVLMARLAVSDKKAADARFLSFLPIIEQESGDPRNFVKKAISWALRQIGKRNRYLNGKAIELATSIQLNDDRSTQWIAKDVLRELTSDAVQARLDKYDPR